MLELIEKKYLLEEQLNILGATWQDLNDDLRITEEEYQRVYLELQQVKMEIKEEM